MPLVHKSMNVRPELWRKLRLHAELSGVPVRDFLAYVIEVSKPIPSGDSPEADALAAVAEANRLASGSPRT